MKGNNKKNNNMRPKIEMGIGEHCMLMLFSPLIFVMISSISSIYICEHDWKSKHVTDVHKNEPPVLIERLRIR